MKIFFIAVLILFLSGCADQISFAEASRIDQVGFLHGLWHGMIAPFAWFVSLFSDSTAIYAIYNNGGWYDFGFMIGIGSFASSSTTVSRRRI